jgi:DNA-binding MarR family transcriptional regulator
MIPHKSIIHKTRPNIEGRMSHYMTALAMQQRGLKPAAKIVLYWLADHHNSETEACFPSLNTLAGECEMDRSTVVRHLEALDEAGLIARDKRTRANGSQTSTAYTLTLTPVAKYNSPCCKTQQPPVAKCDPHNLGTINLGNEEEDTFVSLWEKPESVDDVSRAVTHFNATAEKVGWQKVQKLSQPRRAALLGRFKDCGGFEQWAQAIDRAAVAPHLIGDNDRGWTASFDWLAKPANFIKLMEGNYDKRTNPTGPRNSGRPNPHRSMFAAFCAESADDDGASPEYGGDMRDITPARA